MRIIFDRDGYFSVVEEFKWNYNDWMIILNNKGDLLIRNNYEKKIWSKNEFITYKLELENKNWRSQTIKENHINNLQKIIKSFTALERDRRIDKILKDDNEYKYYIC